MRYRIYRPMVDTPAAREALTLFVAHASFLTVTWVTVAAPYKPTRLERCLCEVPHRFRKQGARMLLGAFGAADDAYAPTSEHITPRAEWTTTRLLRPTPDAAPLDGRTIAACAAACLTVWYTRARCSARLALSEHDDDLIGTLEQAGWVPHRPRSWWQRPQRSLAPWNGTPSLVPVPLTPAPAAELATPRTQLLRELEADQDHQLAGWLATEIRAIPTDVAATVIALPRIADDGAPSTRRTQPIRPRDAEAALRWEETIGARADADIDDATTPADVLMPGRDHLDAPSDDDEDDPATAHRS